jgi:hypothetical protein
LVGAPLLVNRFISHQSTVKEMLVYPSAVRIIREKYLVGKRETPPPVRSGIEGFSDASRRRLRFLAGNTSTPLISQFCLTYHMNVPDGKTIKAQLNLWLNNLRRRLPEAAYLWVLEFQSRGVPHFHVWLNLPHDLPGLRNILAVSWNKIADPGSAQHLAFHKHKRNFIAWEMYNASYACKYLDKQGQKAVPEGYESVGRFWGNSRGLLAIPTEIRPDTIDTPDAIDYQTGEITSGRHFLRVVRTLGKLHERKLASTPWRSRVRSGLTSCTLHNSAPQFRQLLAAVGSKSQSPASTVGGGRPALHEPSE